MKRRTIARFVLEGVEGAITLVVTLASWPVSKRWCKNWGSRPDERRARWPGDRFVSPTHDTHTRAIDISAPAGVVWQWIVQFGLDRAGFYSYELLERIVGIPVTNLESIEPSMQSLAVGDEVRLHPKAPGIPVAALRPGRAICFGLTDDAPRTPPRPDPLRSWSLYVEPEAADRCRLILRGCIEPIREPTVLKRLGAMLEGPVDFVMEQRMLRTVKRLAEATSW